MVLILLSVCVFSFSSSHKKAFAIPDDMCNLIKLSRFLPIRRKIQIYIFRGCLGCEGEEGEENFWRHHADEILCSVANSEQQRKDKHFANAASRLRTKSLF